MDIKEFKHKVEKLVANFQNEHGIAITGLKIERQQRDFMGECDDPMFTGPVWSMIEQTVKSVDIEMINTDQKLIVE